MKQLAVLDLDPVVLDALVARADGLVADGAARLSIGDLAHHVRREHRLRVNKNHESAYKAALIEKRPAYAGLFRTHSRTRGPVVRDEERAQLVAALADALDRVKELEEQLATSFNVAHLKRAFGWGLEVGIARAR